MSKMKNKNIWENVEAPLELHSDQRGDIVDIFYKDHIHHVAVIKSRGGTVRGNHYHEKTTQYMLITHGTLEYWYKPLGSSMEPQCLIMRKGDFVTTPPNEIHALKIPEDNEFIVFTTGERGGMDYESDTIRIEGTIIGASSGTS